MNTQTLGIPLYKDWFERYVTYGNVHTFPITHMTVMHNMLVRTHTIKQVLAISRDYIAYDLCTFYMLVSLAHINMQVDHTLVPLH